MAANRRNARGSTGPKTAAGRAVARRNALRHGLTAAELVLFDEQAAHLARFRRGLRAALDPADPFEEALAERIVLCAWRLRRVARIEAGLINAAAGGVDRRGSAGLAIAFRGAALGLGLASRYEAALDRALRRAHAMLERRQARRRGEAVPPPIAIDIDIDGRDADYENYQTKPIRAPESAAPPALAAPVRRAAGPVLPP
jgi:hypothetical protein